MKTALERLGYGPCHHMTEVLQNPAHIYRWLDLAEGRPITWDTLMAGYASCVDWPAAAYWRELADHYPNAKVILTVRDPERWLASMNATIFKQRARARTWQARAATRISTLLNTDFAAFTRMARLVMTDRVFGDPVPDAETAVKIFTKHVEEVKAAIPPDRLLVFEVAQGWGPLCDFLGVPVPDEPFPRTNDTAAFEQRARGAGRLLFRRSR
jgi:hypothetical protein